jgi:hypothetical protein
MRPLARIPLLQVGENVNYSNEGDLKEARHQSGWFVRF